MFRGAPFLIVVASLSLWTGALARADTLVSELRGLLQDYPKIRQAEKGLQSKRYDIDKAESKNLPQVSMQIDHGPERVDTPAQRASHPGDTWQRPKTTASLTVTQRVFDGQAVSAEIRSAELGYRVTDMSLEGTRQNTMFEGIKAYINVLRQRRLVGMARDNETTIQHQLNLEDERVRRGSGVAVDVLQAKSRLQIAKERRVGFEGALQNAIATYQQLFGHAPQLNAMVDPAPPPEMIPSSLERAIQIGLKENPVINNGALTVEQAREGERLAQSALYPTIDVVGSANYEKNTGAILGTQRDQSVVLRANWNLFSGFATRADMAQAAFNYRASKDNRDYLASKVIEQAKIAWHTLLTAQERTRLLANAVNIASEVFSSRKKLRAAGKETVINVLDAENEVSNAQINYTSAAYDQRTAVYQLLLAMGRLNNDFLLMEKH